MWEQNLKKSGYLYMCNSKNEYDIVNQLYCNKKNNLKKYSVVPATPP